MGETPSTQPAHPVLRLRQGAALPLGPGGETTEDAFDGPLTLLASLDSSGTAVGQLYEDSGDGFSYRTGDYRLTTYEVSRLGSEHTVRVLEHEGNLPPRDDIPVVIL